MMTVRQAASFLSLHKYTLYRWIDKGTVPAYEDANGRILLRLQDLIRPKIGKVQWRIEAGKRGGLHNAKPKP